MSELRIFSYLPNPRIWKATIAARLCGVEIDVRGAARKHRAFAPDVAPYLGKRSNARSREVIDGS